MLIIPPTKEQMLQDEKLTGFIGVRLLRLNPTGDTDADNLDLAYYTGIHCVIGQEIFITPIIPTAEHSDLGHLNFRIFTGADNMEYMSAVVAGRPNFYWLARHRLHVKQVTNCECMPQITYSKGEFHMETSSQMSSVLDGRFPFDAITAETMEDPHEILCLQERIQKFYPEGFYLTMNVIMRCVRERDIMANKINHMLATKPVVRFARRKDIDDEIARFRAKLQSIELVQGAKEKFERTRDLCWYARNVSLCFKCEGYEILVGDPTFDVDFERADTIYQGAINTFVNLEHQTTHTHKRLRRIAITYKDESYYFDDDAIKIPGFEALVKKAQIARGLVNVD